VIPTAANELEIVYVGTVSLDAPEFWLILRWRTPQLSDVQGLRLQFRGKKRRWHSISDLQWPLLTSAERSETRTIRVPIKPDHDAAGSDRYQIRCGCLLHADAHAAAY